MEQTDVPLQFLDLSLEVGDSGFQFLEFFFFLCQFFHEAVTHLCDVSCHWNLLKIF